MWAVLRLPCDESVIRGAAPVRPCTKSRGRWVLAATIVASSMSFIDGTVVNVALPALQTKFNASVVDAQWVVEAYSLFLSALLLVGGSLGDHFGRRKIFLIGVSLFAIASGLCGVAANIHQLIAARALQGLGAALLVPGSLALISSSFSEKERGRAIGTWSSFSAVTAALGPVIGGWLIEHLSWRAVFFINLPLALIVVFISLRQIAETADRESKKVDWLGALLAAAGMGLLVFGLLESSRLGFTNRIVLFTFTAAGALIVIFLAVEARLSHPMLPLQLFRSRTFSGANLLTFFLYAALGGTLFFLPLNLIQVQHYSATAAGAALLPFILLISFLSRWSGGLVSRYGARLPLVTGPLIAGCGFALFIIPAIGGSYWTTFFPAIVVLGTGMAISVAPLTTTVMNSVRENRVGIASGINNAVARSAGLLAIAVLGIVMLHVFNIEIDRRVSEWNLAPDAAESLQAQRNKLVAATLTEEPAMQKVLRRAIDESFVTGFRVIMTIGVALAIASALTAAVLIESRTSMVRKSVKK